MTLTAAAMRTDRIRLETMLTPLPRRRPWAAAGATWWIEADWSADAADVPSYARRRLAAGPPR
ncbi:MAG TPA: hypothetical protein VFR67_19015 [Pilimelia sp.]|nr:hypothetical protein [Pilimelia sp.]